MGEHVAPQVVDDVLPDPAREVGLQVAGAEVDEADPDEGDYDPGEHGEVLGADAPVDGHLEQIGHGEAAQRDGDHGDDAEDGAPPVRVGEPREPGELELVRQVHELKLARLARLAYPYRRRAVFSVVAMIAVTLSSLA